MSDFDVRFKESDGLFADGLIEVEVESPSWVTFRSVCRCGWIGKHWGKPKAAWRQYRAHLDEVVHSRD